MFIAVIQAATTAFGSLCSTLVLAGCASTMLETTPNHPAHLGVHAHHHPPAATQEAPASDSNDAAGADKAPAERWTCPMHPEVVRDEQGKCPTCGMKLVEREEPPPSGDEK